LKRRRRRVCQETAKVKRLGRKEKGSDSHSSLHHRWVWEERAGKSLLLPKRGEVARKRHEGEVSLIKGTGKRFGDLVERGHAPSYTKS